MKAHRLPVMVAVLLLAGCKATEFKTIEHLADRLPLVKSEQEDQTGQHAAPVRLVAIWSEAVYHAPGQKPVRGFGGRLYFYDAQNRPVPAEGQLIVYGYDDASEAQPAPRPDRKFVFTPEQFNAHFTPSPLGPSYSIWLPWDRIGGYKKPIGLIPIFNTTDGGVVTGEQTVAILPGKTPPQQEAATPNEPATAGHPNRDPAVRPASYQQLPNSWHQAHPYVPKARPEQRLQSTTIELPMSTTRRLIETARAQTAVADKATGQNKPKGRPAQKNDAKPELSSKEAPARLTPHASRSARPIRRAPEGESARSDPGCRLSPRDR